jgi:hypothetical protein
MTTWDLIIALFYHVDEQLHDMPKHPEATSGPVRSSPWGCCMPSKAGATVPSIGG